jgi:hypothetical protein
MIAENIQRKMLEKILDSKTINFTKHDKDLLYYLFDATKSGKEVKEATIAMDVFNRGKDFDSTEDTIVRVHIYNLRKKLKTYYLTEGKDDNLYLSIPKGRYELVFNGPKKDTQMPPLFSNQIYLSIIVFLIIIIGALIFHIQSQSKKSSNIDSHYHQVTTLAKNPIWARFIESDHPTLIVLGDRFTFHMYPKSMQNKLIVRHGHINSFAEFQQLVAANPELLKNANISETTMLGDREIQWMWNLLPNLCSLLPEKLKFKSSSELTWEDIKQNNIIFLGCLKTLYKMDSFMEKLHFRYSFYPHTIYRVDAFDDTTESLSAYYNPYNSFGDSILNPDLKPDPTKKNYNRDYAITALIPGPNNSHIFIFAGFYAIGVDAATRYFGDFSLDTLDEKVKADITSTGYFEMLFEVGGFRDTIIEEQRIVSNPIAKDHFNETFLSFVK